jgi:hypothetical protein
LCTSSDQRLWPRVALRIGAMDYSELTIPAQNRTENQLLNSLPLF